MPARPALLVSLAILAAAGPLAAQSPAGPVRSARTIAYHARDIVPLRARVHYTTLIVLPDGEEVVEVTCGDKEVWLVNVRGGLVSVKPATTATETNLNLVTTTGQIYAFLLTEVSADKTQEADLTVYLEPEAPDRLGTSDLKSSKPRFVSAEQARAELEDRLGAFTRSYPLALHFDYRFKPDTRPVFLQAIFHDDHRTFIRAAARELPTVYELKDGQPNLVNFEVQDGTYVIPKILDDGYLMIGKARVGFRRVEGGAR